MAHLIVSRQELLTAALFASKDETRYVITGVYIDFVARVGKPRLVSSDGRRLTVIKSVAEQEVEEAEPMLIRPDYIKLFASFSKACGGDVFPWLRLERIGSGKGLRVATVGGKSTLVIEDGCFIDGVYPDWTKLLPGKRAARTPVSDLGLNSECLADYAKAAKALQVATPVLQMNLVDEPPCVEVRFPGCEQFYSLLMQCRTSELDYQPEFTQIVSQFESSKTSTEVPEGGKDVE